MYSKFVELFHDKTFPQDLKAKALQFVIIPMFAASFDKGEGEKVHLLDIKKINHAWPTWSDTFQACDFSGLFLQISLLALSQKQLLLCPNL